MARLSAAHGKFTCPYCPPNKTFTRKCTRDRHVDAQHRFIKYACTECTFITTQHGNCKTHLKKYHALTGKNAKPRMILPATPPVLIPYNGSANAVVPSSSASESGSRATSPPTSEASTGTETSAAPHTMSTPIVPSMARPSHSDTQGSPRFVRIAPRPSVPVPARSHPSLALPSDRPRPPVSAPARLASTAAAVVHAQRLPSLPLYLSDVVRPSMGAAGLVHPGLPNGPSSSASTPVPLYTLSATGNELTMAGLVLLSPSAVRDLTRSGAPAMINVRAPRPDASNSSSGAGRV
ncbi:hypothetical protein EXIGLDRAFT_695957 [Exidia glandulosa HHB12029]|uniref:C2H2-type domain-containing protein n=1 Tax=Exidia glandulosa HHB12029 TaxID=1314781 RepID=A0A165QGG9_EXIGL|nr:hypothetical protein EXIGLDRAFT_695957 [Exidia glandulosa HHB12029]